MGIVHIFFEKWHFLITLANSTRHSRSSARAVIARIKKRTEANSIFICKRHFKSKCILSGKCFNVMAYFYKAKIDIHVHGAL